MKLPIVNYFHLKKLQLQFYKVQEKVSLEILDKECAPFYSSEYMTFLENFRFVSKLKKKIDFSL